MSQQDDLTGTAGAVRAAARYVRGGGLVVLPTDTVYGIGCSAASASATSRLLAAKGRARRKPPPVLVSAAADLAGLVPRLPDAARRLTEELWPGALTLVLDADPGLGWDLGEAAGTLAVRVPAHPVALDLLRRVGPMAVTSANPTGRPPATDADQARAAFPGRLRLAGQESGRAGAGGAEDCGTDILLIDAGPTPGPCPSTIVDLSGRRAEAPLIIRHGAVEAHQVAAAVYPLPVTGARPPAQSPTARAAGGSAPGTSQGAPGEARR